MDAGEDLPGLRDTLGLAKPYCRQGVASGAVDAGQAKDVHGEAVRLAERAPAPFRLDPAFAARAGGRGCCALVHPGAAGVAVDPGGREVADPLQALYGGDVGAVAVERRIAVCIRRNGEEDVRRAGERLHRIRE